MENETFTTELESNGTIAPDLIAQMIWENDRQLARAQWERKNDRHERPSDYRKLSGVACALPIKPKQGKKSKNA